MNNLKTLAKNIIPKEYLLIIWRSFLIYGNDYHNRLEEAGFTVKVDRYIKNLGNDAIGKYGLIEDKDIYFCTKP